MPMPEYDGGSIVNLMSSIGAHFGSRLPYAPLKSLEKDDLRHGDTIVLMVLDGLGFEYLSKKGADSVLSRHVRGRMTSVFPSTTSASLTSFATGVAPQQHGITGWFMHLKEVGMVLKILPFMPRVGSTSLDACGVDPGDVFDQKTVYDMFDVPTRYVVHEMFAESPYTRAMTGGATGYYYSDLDGFADAVCSAATEGGQSYVYAYWPTFDTLSHMHGISSPEVSEHFREIDAAVSSILGRLSGTHTTLVITADHGLIDVGSKDVIRLADHPGLEDCLSQPLCGEARAAYCYVHPGRADAFESYISEHLSDVCTCVPSDELVAKGYYGIGDPHRALGHRIGDYVLLMKDTYVLVDQLLGESEHVMKGYHGGLSCDEVYVPLIIARC